MKLGEKVVKYRTLILLISLFLLIPATIGYLSTGINYDMLSYLPKDMETMKGQDLLLKEFGKGGFSIVVTENMSKKDVAGVVSEYKKIKHVDSVLDLNKVINPSVPRSMYPELIRKHFDNKKASMIVVFFNTSTSDSGSLEAIKEIRSVSTKNCYVSGMTACIQDLKSLCEGEELKYVVIAVILSLLAMMVLLDSYVAPVIFLICIGMAILYNMGSNIFFGEISYITQAIAAVLQLGVTMDYSIFLWHSYMENLDEGEDDEQAMSRAVNDTLVSVTGSSITTVAGFLALCFMTYTMGLDLGIVMAKGVILGVISSITILPSMLLFFRKILKKTRHRTLIPDTHNLAKGLTSRYGLYIIIFLLLAGPAIYGYEKNNVVYDFEKILNGRQGLSVHQAPFLEANKKLEEHFHIGTTHMIIADAELSGEKGSAMTKDIEKVPGVKNVLGADAFLGSALPKELLPNEIKNSLLSDKHQMIMVNSEYKVSTSKCNAQIDEINKITEKYDKSAKVIGEGPAMKDLINLTGNDFKVVNIISIIAVFFIIMFVLKSVTLPVILVAVIEFAIYVNLGISGYTGLELAFIVPVCISTIQLGSTVDYAILTSTRYKTERMRGKDKRDAIVTAAATSMPSIITSAAGFFTATFGVGLYSDVGVISTICILMARGALISMATVILILPAMLMAFDKIICKTTLGMGDLYKKSEGDMV